jgi:hypothetical protein
MRHALTVVLMLGVVAFVGCRKKPVAEPETAPSQSPTTKPRKDDGNAKMPPVASNPPKASGGGSSSGGGNAASMAVMRGKQITNVKGLMLNIGKFYHQYNAENGKSPAKLEEFLTYIRRDYPAAAKALEDGDLVLSMNAPLSSNVVLAYEYKPYVDGTRVVLMGDGSVSTMSAQDFQAAQANR